MRVTHDIPALRDMMKACIERKYDLGTMAKKCQKHAETYNVDNGVTDQLLRKVGLI